MKDIVIVGGGSSSDLVLWNHPNWEYWGLIALEPLMERCDLWFELHPLSVLSAREIARCRKATVPVLMIQAYARIPRSIRFPVELVQGHGSRLFTNSFCYQIAYAIHYGVQALHLYGLGDLVTGSARERVFERLGVAYWVGVAQGRGITVDIPDRDRVIWERFLYGLEYWQEVKWVRQELRSLKQVLTQKKLDGFTTERRVSQGAARIARKL